MGKKIAQTLNKVWEGRRDEHTFNRGVVFQAFSCFCMFGSFQMLLECLGSSRTVNNLAVTRNTKCCSRFLNLANTIANPFFVDLDVYPFPPPGIFARSIIEMIASFHNASIRRHFSQMYDVPQCKSAKTTNDYQVL